MKFSARTSQYTKYNTKKCYLTNINNIINSLRNTNQNNC